MLPSRVHASNDDFEAAWQFALKGNFEVSWVESLAKIARQRIVEQVSFSSPWAVAWSGGKDSLVLEKLVEDLCPPAGVLGMCESDLEYPAFEAWLMKNKPRWVSVVRTGQDFAWLAKRPAMLFPKHQSKVGSRWYSQVQIRAQDRLCDQTGSEVIIVGRRRADNNIVGRNGVMMKNKGTRKVVSPIYDWRHEDVLAFLAYHRVSLPPIYGWPNGWTEGTHPWPQRYFPRTDAEAWSEIAEIDSGIINRAAAAGIDSAVRFRSGPTLPKR